MSTLLTDTSFKSLTAKLRELFELDKSDLDFGIYRILAAKQDQINAFLNKRLREKVAAVLAAHGGGQATLLEAELAKAIEQAKELGVDPDQSKKVKELKAQLAEASGTEGGGLEADIYNHLLAFFSRYYEAGDFISKRRWKGDTYAIPYDGSEVVLHWANKDQYYIKSGEALKDYRFSVAGGKSVRFKLVDAAQGAKDNNKTKDGGERRYILDKETPFQVTAGELALRFVYRPATQEDWLEEDLAGATDAAQKKPPTQETLIAQAERIVLNGLAQQWKTPLAAPAQTKDGKAKDKTELRAKLEHFVAKNTFDYFIHKNLGAFLKRELDFYIKNEVVRMDELENLGDGHLKQVQGKVKAIRQVASDIIDFLHQVEEFQRKLWLKKKMVVSTDWIVTTDKLNPELLAQVAGNKEQWKQWEELGFKQDGLQGQNWGKVAYFNGTKLPVDTSLFKPAFAEKVIAGIADLDGETTGTLVHSENFQGLNLLKERYGGEVKCVYIDPPYNTEGDGFFYKDAYGHSSWLAMIVDRLSMAHQWVESNGVLYASIGANEKINLEHSLNLSFGSENRVEEIIWAKNSTKNQSPTFSTNHEYVEVFAKDIVLARQDFKMFREPKPGFMEVQELIEQLNVNYPSIEEIETALRGLYRQHKKSLGENESLFEDGEGDEDQSDDWKGLYNYNGAEYRDGEGKYVTPNEAKKRQAKIWVYREDNPSMPQVKEDSQKTEFKDPKDPTFRFYKPLHPETGKECPAPKRGWAWPFQPHGKQANCFSDLAADHRIVWGEDENKIPQTKRFLHEVETNVAKSIVSDFTDGEKELTDVFGRTRAFSNPKPTTLIKRFCSQTGSRDDFVLDFFAGSGTTAHAVINLNREDGGSRKFILIEMGDYFHTVLKPRVTKVLYSPLWKAGQAQEHNACVSALIKVLRLESYEDALNNLPAPKPLAAVTALPDEVQDDYLLRYALDLELGPALLNLPAFTDPCAYQLTVQPLGGEELTPVAVDLVETFNALLGLRVTRMEAWEHFAPEFKTTSEGRVIAKLGTPKADGGFAFRLIEGVDRAGTRIGVLWRKLSGDCAQDGAALEAYADKIKLNSKEKGDHRDYQVVYMNGPITLPQPTQELRTVCSLEEEFRRRMFEG